MNLFRTLTAALVLLAGTIVGQAQSLGVDAGSFDNWQFRSDNAVAAGADTLTVRGNGRATTPDGLTFLPLNTNAPVTILDGANTEVVTPSAVNCPLNALEGACNFTATFSNAHERGVTVQTGSAGLQEAINYQAATGGLVIAGSGSGVTDAILAAAVVPANVSVLDLTGGSFSTVTGAGGATAITNAQTANGVTLSSGGTVQRTVFTFDATSTIDFTDEAAVGQYGSLKLADFPAGDILFLGASIDLDITLLAPFIDTAAGDVALGTTAVDDGNALATTEVDVLPSTAIAALVAKSGPVTGQSTSTEAAVAFPAAGTTDVDLFLNIRIDDNAAHATTANNLISGTVTVVWVSLGDF